jgi:hypothetical protein
MNMFKEDNSEVRTLSFNNNGPDGGGHAIIAYGLERGIMFPDIYYVKVYDNSHPESTNRIAINTLDNNGNGSWDDPDWAGWGGSKWLYLRDPVVNYLSTPTMAKGNKPKSPFILDDNELQIFCPRSPAIQIVDQSGNITGFTNNTIRIEIPGSSPFILDNGSKIPPFGYSLPTANYSVVMNYSVSEPIETFFFTGNKTFSYSRTAFESETDRLFFDGGITVSNPDELAKQPVSLLNIINETTREKVFVLRELELLQNDSVRIENPDDETFKLITYSSGKNYNIELNLASETGLGIFSYSQIYLQDNASHTFVPDWSDLTNATLMVLVDFGNDATIDDTLWLHNDFTTGLDDKKNSPLSKHSYILTQNYPNPVTSETSIEYSIPQRSFVTLAVYDVLGNEVATLVNEEKEKGVFTVRFNASDLASGIYFYKLAAGSFIITKKMFISR